MRLAMVYGRLEGVGCVVIYGNITFTPEILNSKEYYPIKGSAQFLMDIMVEHPKYKWLVIPVSMSPEQGYFVSEGA